MKKNKRSPGGILFCLALGAFLAFRSAGYIREIHGDRKSIAQYRKTLKAERPLPPGFLSRLEDRAAELRERETPEEKFPSALPLQPDIENPAGRIRGLLQTHAVGVERLRTLAAEGSAGTEFVLAGSPVNFLRFLRAAAELPLPLSYISIKTDDHSSNINVTARFSHEP
ncbi:MAG: hypothetical protein LBK63_12745 [Treponema sp.]|jgi:hypothetical protein|nr:hypothetical protein [Treponema sp.]